MLKIFLFLGVLQHLQTWAKCAPLSNKHDPCIPLRDCPQLNILVNTKKLHYGTVALLTLLYCSPEKRQIHVKCISRKKVERFMDNADLLPDTCGIGNTAPKIQGGEVADIDEHPWIALLRYRNTHNQLMYGCHGSILSQRYILTAGHCVDPEFTVNVFGMKLYSVVLGEYDTRTKIDCVRSPLGYEDCNEEAQELMVESYHVHPKYNIKNYANDIALVRLDRDADTSSDFIKSICLPPPKLRQPFGETLWIAGWGKTENGSTNPVKVKAKFALNPTSSCKVQFKLTSRHFCASSEERAKTCPGDSGGPLMMKRRTRQGYRMVQVGVYSAGVWCTLDQRLSIYTQVSPYIEWIITTIHK